MNWIRPEKRLAVYLRDGLACCWCGATVEDGAKMTLDHCLPYSRGGSNHETNLVTACLRCNSSRGNRSLAAFGRAVADYRHVAEEMILGHVRRCRARKLNVKAAKVLMRKRARGVGA